jgi:hypothetical protein
MEAVSATTDSCQTRTETASTAQTLAPPARTPTRTAAHLANRTLLSSRITPADATPATRWTPLEPVYSRPATSRARAAQAHLPINVSLAKQMRTSDSTVLASAKNSSTSSHQDSAQLAIQPAETVSDRQTTAARHADRTRPCSRTASAPATQATTETRTLLSACCATSLAPPVLEERQISACLAKLRTSSSAKAPAHAKMAS